MKNKRNRKEIDEILLRIKEIQDRNGNQEEIDFIEIKKEILGFTEFYPQITEEELAEIFTKYDRVLFCGKYHEFLEQKNFETKILDWIRRVALDKKVSQLNKGEIKEKVGYFVAEFDKHSPKTSKELLDNYDVIFDKQYGKYLDLREGEFLISSYIKKEDINKVMTDKDTIKDKIKKIIQDMNPFDTKKMSFDIEEILENYDLIFDWAYEQNIEKVKIAGLLQKGKAGEIVEIAQKLHDEDIARATYIKERVIPNKEKRKEFIASMKLNSDNNQSDSIERDKEKRDREEEASYTTIRGGDITFHNIRKKKKVEKKEPEVMEFMKKPRKKIIQFPQKNDQTDRLADGEDDDRWQK